MKNLLVATAAVLALSIAGAGAGIAQTSHSTPSTQSPSSATTQTPSSSATMSQSSPGQAQGTAVNLSESQIKQAQEQLKSAGLYKGTADGKMGTDTKQAVSEFQQKHGLKQTGTLDQETLAALNNQGSAGSLAGSTAHPSGAASSGTPNSPSTTPKTSR